MATKKDTAKKGEAALTKAGLIAALVEANQGLTRKQVKDVVDSLVDIGHKQLKKAGTFTVPGFAKFTVVKKPAQKERKGINPFTGQEQIFKAKPARKVVKGRPVKAAKDAVA